MACKKNTKVIHQAVYDHVTITISKAVTCEFLEHLQGEAKPHDIAINMRDLLTKIGYGASVPETTRKKSGSKAMLFPKAAFGENYANSFTTAMPRSADDVAWIEEVTHAIVDNLVPGAFRMSGNRAKVRMLMQKVNDGGEKVQFGDFLTNSDCSVHDLVGLLKAYLLNLEEPIIPKAQNVLWKQVLDFGVAPKLLRKKWSVLEAAGKSTTKQREAFRVEAETRKLRASQMLLILFPANRREVFKALLRCLASIIEQNRVLAAQDPQTLDAFGLMTCFVVCVFRLSDDELLKMKSHENPYSQILLFLVQNHVAVFAEPTYMQNHVKEAIEFELSNVKAESSAKKKKSDAQESTNDIFIRSDENKGSVFESQLKILTAAPGTPYRLYLEKEVQPHTDQSLMGLQQQWEQKLKTEENKGKSASKSQIKFLKEKVAQASNQPQTPIKTPHKQSSAPFSTPIRPPLSTVNGTPATPGIQTPKNFRAFPMHRPEPPKSTPVQVVRSVSVRATPLRNFNSYKGCKETLV